jgi:hypothetical protein
MRLPPGLLPRLMCGGLAPVRRPVVPGPLIRLRRVRGPPTAEPCNRSLRFPDESLQSAMSSRSRGIWSRIAAGSGTMRLPMAAALMLHILSLQPISLDLR